ncbi:MFS transporter [Rugamonas apoptosis]|uniref:MFS transporter n=1 Tax=Rugamonas apoptosis TaxID=2758570 RepID=A0A7W2IK11_9BURK|nr:MFS transporter [Rugamonas apoptosis]MBA5686912.1 MFS transporter [Rugamonas apoptosis]
MAVPASAPDPQRATLLRDPNFRWLLRGGAISMLGDQLTMLALPWLVLKLTGDTLALGLVIALMSAPRALFILIGGALVDRHSPKRVLMLSKYANALLLAMLTLLVLNNAPTLTLPLGPSLSITLALNPHVTLWLVYALALGLGLAQAFGIPSGTSILPRVVAPQRLEQANGILMGMRQLTTLAGPLLAALLIALAGDSGGAVRDALGLALAFGFDCASFLLSAWTLAKVRELPDASAAQTAQTALTARAAATPDSAGAAHTGNGRQPSVWRAVGAGLAMVWRDTALRLCFSYWGIVALFIGGAMQVALPALGNERLHGATAFGLLMAANGAGSLAGMGAAAIAGARLRMASFGAMVLLADMAVGALVMPLGRIDRTWQGALLLLAIGAVSGYMQVAVFTWIQRRVPPHMMGRTMSIFMFIFMGLAPLSAAATGWLLQSITLAQLFAGGGATLIALATLAWLFTPMRAIRASATAPTTAQQN